MKTAFRHFRSFVLMSAGLLIGLTTQLQSAVAASSQWQDLGGGEARIVAIKDPQTGKLDGIVEVRLKDGWKTYWKSPGGSGIAPEFDFSVSNAVSVEEISFPVPVWIRLPDASFYGYKDHVSFLFSGYANSPDAAIRLEMLLGVCEEICIPATASFEIAAEALNSSDPKAEIAIALARSRLPTEPIKDFLLDAAYLDGKTIRVTGKTDGQKLSKAVVSLEDVWVSDPNRLEINEDGSVSAVFNLPDFALKSMSEGTTLNYSLLEHDEESAGGTMVRAVDGKLALRTD